MKKLILILFFVFVVPVGIAHSVDLSFGTIEYTLGDDSMNATLDPISGSITCNSGAFFTCPAFGTPGTTLIQGDRGNVVDIACRTTARISNGNLTFDLGRSEVALFGQSTVRCRGLGNNELSHTITGNPTNDTLYWGGRLRVRGVGAGNFSGVYTTNGGGNARPQTIRITFL